MDSLNLDRESVVPLYYQIHQQLLQQIRLGRFKPGRPLPSEQVISRRLRVSRMTARQALKSLCSQGVAYSQRGKGTFVSESKLEKTSGKFFPSARRWRLAVRALIRRLFPSRWFLPARRRPRPFAFPRARSSSSCGAFEWRIPCLWALNVRRCLSGYVPICSKNLTRALRCTARYRRTTKFISFRQTKSWRQVWRVRKKPGFCEFRKGVRYFCLRERPT